MQRGVITALVVPALVGRWVRLEPLSMDHVDESVHAANEDRTPYGYMAVPDTVATMTLYVKGLLRDFAAGAVVPFAQIDVTTDRVVGMTRYLTIRSRPGEPLPFAVEIGGTWLAASAQRTRINTEAKYLLLHHAFEEWGVARVDIKTDDRNERAKAAIVRIGATFEGVLRHWQPSQVSGEETRYRDSAMFCVIDEEWPAVRSRLEKILH